jgi:hypothetical protein
MRFRVEPRDVRPEYAARRLGPTYPEEIARGFSRADTGTANHDLDAVNKWRMAGHPHLNGGEHTIEAHDASTAAADRIVKLATRRRIRS